MFDPKSRMRALAKENKDLKEKLERAQRELAESVRTEVELGAAIRRLSDELDQLRAQKVSVKNTENTKNK